MTKEILDKLRDAIQHEAMKPLIEAMIDGVSTTNSDDILNNQAQAALEVFKEYAVFLEEGAEPKIELHVVCYDCRKPQKVRQGKGYFPCGLCKSRLMTSDWIKQSTSTRNGKPVVRLPKKGDK